MTDDQDPKFLELMQTLTKAIMLVSNPGTEVDDRTKARLREPIKAVDMGRSNSSTPEEICAAVCDLLGATPLLAPPDALFLEPLRKKLEEYEAGTAWGDAELTRETVEFRHS